MSNEPIFLQINNEIEIEYSIIIEEDNYATYGYLLRGKEIVSDVWLYNIIDSPDFVDWENPELMPFPSPMGLSKSDAEIIRIVDEKLIKVIWEKQDASDKIWVKVFYNDELFAILIEDNYPGMSVNAMADSRLANVLIQY